MKIRSAEDKIIEIDVLLVEDSPDDALIIQETLSETLLTFCRVKWVEKLSDARQWLDKEMIDVILLDLILPDSRGIDSIKGIKNHAPHIPIIVLTGIGNEEMGRLAIQEGAQDYIFKNEINPSVLENSLRFAIERSQLLIQLENKKQQMMESEHRMRRIIEKNADGIMIADRLGKLKFLNPAAEKLIGIHRVEWDSQGITRRLTETMKKYAGIYRDSIELDLSQEREEPFIVEIRVEEIDWEGETAYLASIRNVTERKQLEKSLLIEKERLDITLRSIADGVIATDKNKVILSLNPAAAQLTGFSQQNISGLPIDRILGSEKHIEDKNIHSLYYGTCTIFSMDTDIVIEYSRAPILDKVNNLSGYIFVLRDITLRKKITEEMLKVQKLESLGVVAGRLAHEYDNVLTIILGNLSIAKKYIIDNKEAFKTLEKAEQSSQKARILTDQLHTFSRRDSSIQKNVSISKLLREIFEELLGGSPGKYNIIWTVDDNLWPLEFDKNQIYTALLNIVENAVESMPEGGLLELSIENTVLSEKKYLPIETGNYVKISITDHGNGIEKEFLQKIFDPFYTTKENNQGMGLTTSFSIVRKHDGTIEVSSEIGSGSTFTVFLPALNISDARPPKRSKKTSKVKSK